MHSICYITPRQVKAQLQAKSGSDVVDTVHNVAAWNLAVRV